MSALRAAGLVSKAEYRESERQPPTKSEDFAGKVLPMAGASYTQNRTRTSLAVNLYLTSRNKPCAVLGSNMRERVADANVYFYPDVIVVCGQPQFEDDQQDNLVNPTLFIEVLSPPIEALERGEQFEAYWHIPSLCEYVLVPQDRMHVEHYSRQPEGQWSHQEYARAEQTVYLASTDASLSMHLISPYPEPNATEVPHA